jgi:hypothetical protein
MTLLQFNTIFLKAFDFEKHKESNIIPTYQNLLVDA